MKVESLKYGNSLHRWWNAWLLHGPGVLGIAPPPEVGGEVWVGWSEAGGVITEGSGRTWTGRDPMFLLFWPDRWYNALVWTAGDGVRWYCNVTTPPTWDSSGLIRYTDLDLDLMVFSNGYWRVLDRDEFNTHRARYGYPPEVVQGAEAGLAELIQLRQHRKGPFAPASIAWLQALLAAAKEEP